jgi:mevalonate kinase
VMKAAASAPGKVILFGEHFVVSGYPALVTAIEPRAVVRVMRAEKKTVVKSGNVVGVWSEGGEQLYPPKNVKNHLQPLYDMATKLLEENSAHGCFEAEIFSQIPGSAGLGSSAAVSVAFAKALSDLYGLGLGQEAVIKYAMLAEREFHGTPSGIDPHIAALGGAILYSGPGNYRRVNINNPVDIAVLHTGVRRKTSTMVAHVQDFARNNPEVFREMAEFYGEVLARGLEAVEKGDVVGLGRLMTLNHILLRVLGVSSKAVEKAFEALLGLGMYGAKLTGAGGGGCVIAVGPKTSYSRFSGLSQQFQTAFTTKIACHGVVSEV